MSIAKKRVIHFKNAHGMSLALVMLIGAIISASALYIAKATSSHEKMVFRKNQNRDMRTILKQMKMILSDRKSCEYTLAGKKVNLPSSDPNPVDKLISHVINPSDPSDDKVDRYENKDISEMKYGSSLVSIESYSILTLSPITETYGQAILEVTFNRGRRIGVDNTVKSQISLNVHLVPGDPDQKIETCRGTDNQKYMYGGDAFLQIHSMNTAAVCPDGFSDIPGDMAISNSSVKHGSYPETKQTTTTCFSSNARCYTLYVHGNPSTIVYSEQDGHEQLNCPQGWTPYSLPAEDGSGDPAFWYMKSIQEEYKKSILSCYFCPE